VLDGPIGPPMPYVISNLRRDDSCVVALSRAAMDRLLAALVEAGQGRADARWERELVVWLDRRREALRSGERDGLDLSEIAWTPERFPEQQGFLLALLDGLIAARGPGTDGVEVGAALQGLRHLVEDYPREIVVVGRRWAWNGRAPERV
jgi:hypothetical protein